MKLKRETIDKIKYELSWIYRYKFKEYKNNKKIVILLAPNYGNLGDQAIIYAMEKFLNDKLNGYEFLEVSRPETYKYGKVLEKLITKDDIVCIPGGGNMGNQYINEEDARRYVIDKFKHAKVISFPQTIFFTDDENGKFEFEKTKSIYNKNKNLTVIAREDLSYDCMKKNFTECNVVKCPDIVFYLNNKLKKSKNIKREHIMTCLRRDKECYIGQEVKADLIEKLKLKYDNIIVSDTKIKEKVSKEERNKKLFSLWDKFYNSKVVITDRLHGMIFCAITKTPCIVTRSLDYKVIGSYKWIEHLNYIRLVDKLEFEYIDPIIEELINLNDIEEFDLDSLYFDKLIDEIGIK